MSGQRGAVAWSNARARSVCKRCAVRIVCGLRTVPWTEAAALSVTFAEFLPHIEPGGGAV